jgi:hypothetical protein
MTWWWLSFASEERFLGAVIVQARSFAEARTVAKIRGVNPGGEALVLPVPSEASGPPPGYADRLLSKTDCEELCARWFPSAPKLVSAVDAEEEMLS